MKSVSSISAFFLSGSKGEEDDIEEGQEGEEDDVL